MRDAGDSVLLPMAHWHAADDYENIGMSALAQPTLPASALNLILNGTSGGANKAVPPVPQKLEDTGLPVSFFEQHILRVL